MLIESFRILLAPIRHRLSTSCGLATTETLEAIKSLSTGLAATGNLDYINVSTGYMYSIDPSAFEDGLWDAIHG